MKNEISRRDFIMRSAQAGLLIGLSGSKYLNAASNEPYDLIIKNGTVIDGIKNKEFKAVQTGCRGRNPNWYLFCVPWSQIQS